MSGSIDILLIFFSMGINIDIEESFNTLCMIDIEKQENFKILPKFLQMLLNFAGNFQNPKNFAKSF